jgi:hypothetical protein
MPDFGRWTSNGGDPSLNEINRTDRFLDSLANQQPVYSTDPSEAELAHLLAGWRDEVRTPPLMSPVTPRDAMVALTRAVESRKRSRTSMAVVGSVAAAVLCLGGFGAVVAGAGPGDALYGLHTMLFGQSEQTRADKVTLASQQLAEVQQLIDQGQWQAAQDKLQAVTTTVATVNDEQQKHQLVTQWQDLTVKVDAKDPNATLPPGVPPPSMPEPAVVAPGSTTSTTPTTASSSSPDTSGSSTSPSPSDTGTSAPSSSVATSATSPSSAPSPSSTTSPSQTTPSGATGSPTSSPAAPEPSGSTPPPTTQSPTTTPPPTSTTTTHAETTTTTTTQAPTAAGPAAGAPAAGGGAPTSSGAAPGVVGDAPGAGAGAPPAGSGGGAPVGGSAQVVAPPPAVTPEAPRQQHSADSPVTQNPVTQNQPSIAIPVTTTPFEMAPPRRQRGG